MYGSQKLDSSKQPSGKNPNRVTGGIKGQGVDHIVMVSEDGFENQVPTHKYVQSLDEQLRKLRTTVSVLERKLSRFDSAITSLNQRRQNND
tara:strand:+ start:8053 stop:8325 length:273 start_codon:yes stop_codon:yes gene_type:complete